MLTTDEIKPIELSKPRFEFRSFGQDFDNAAKRMARFSVPIPEALWEKSSEDIYIVSPFSNVSIKIRNNKLSIKKCIQIVDGLEQWDPVMEISFPLESSVLKDVFFPALQVKPPKFINDSYTLDTLMELVNKHPSLQAVKVHKKRFSYNVNNTICETGIVLINGAKMITISSESTIIEDVKKTIKDIGLEGAENINYLLAIKRVIGMVNKLLAN